MMFIEQNTSPDNFILFRKLPIYINNGILYNNNLLYCQNKGDQCYLRQKSKGEVYVGSLGDKFNDHDHTIAFWYTDSRCTFFKGLWKLIDKPSKNFKIKITHDKKLYEKHTIAGKIYLYIHKDYYLDLFQKDTIPLIMQQFIENYKEKRELLVANPIEQEKYDFEKKLKVNLFKHQRDNISWMKNVQKDLFLNTSKDFNIAYIESLDEYILYDSKYKIFKFEEEHKKNLNGGLICDEVGLGKTLTCYGYINLTGKNLIVVPNRLVKQWLNEFYKYYGDIKYPIIPFSTIRSLSKLDSFDKGIILCPVNIFASPKYYGRCEIINFDRIFIDEAHEYLFDFPKTIKETEIYNNLLSLKGKEKWLLTATPFEKGELNINGFYRFLTGEKLGYSKKAFESKSIENKYLIKNKIYYQTLPQDYKKFSENYINYIFSNFPYRYNTKESVKNEIKLPGIQFETKRLKMNKIERALYNAAKGDLEKQIQLCTHFQITDDDANILGDTIMTIDSAKKKLLERYNFRLKKKNKELEKTQCLITKNEIIKDIHTLTSRINIITSLDVKQECSICMDDIENPSITSCGHIFCTECLDMIFNDKVSYDCPICRNHLTNQDVFEIKDEDQITNDDSNKYGTKISYLLELIKSNPTSRFILFSQWDKMFKMVGQILDENNIQFVNLKGNMYTIANSIRKFKVDSDIKVIMLSTDKANSGCNLTEANHIVFLDTYYLTNDIMKQAVGRAHRIGQTKEIKVTKLIMENTVEDKLGIQNTFDL